MSNQRGKAAIIAEIDTLEEAQKTLRRTIARKKRRGKDVTDERAEMARIGQRLAHRHDVLAELEAGGTVVSAPSQSEITAARKHAKAVKDIAVEDAMTKSGLNLIKKAIEATRKTSSGVKKG